MQLPDRPNLRHLRDRAKDLVRFGAAPTLAAAQFQIARDYGFPSWPQLKRHVEILEVAGQLRQAIQTEDLDRVKALLTAKPGLHRGPREDGDDGPLSWIAECRGPWATPSPTRLAIAQWLIDNGSDVHQGGDGPLMRAAHARCIPMMDLLVRNGANVNGLWRGFFPVMFVPCENLDAVALQWLLDHGADPNRGAAVAPVLPDSDFLWWKAQLARKQLAVERATRSIVLVRRIAYCGISAAVLWLVFTPEHLALILAALSKHEIWPSSALGQSALFMSVGGLVFTLLGSLYLARLEK